MSPDVQSFSYGLLALFCFVVVVVVFVVVVVVEDNKVLEWPQVLCASL